MKLIYVKWKDAMASDTSWMSLDQAIEWGEDVCSDIDEIGYLIEENKEYILLASKINGGSEDSYTMVACLMKIPKKYIVERKDLIIK